MKRDKTISYFSLAAAISLVTAGSALALTSSQESSIKKAMNAAPAAEMGAKAAELVGQASKSDKSPTAVTVVKSAAEKNASVVAPVLSSIVTLDPNLAPDVAAAASEVLPDQAENFAKIAAMAAPDLADQITVSVTKAAPKSADKVAQIVSTTSKQAKAKTSASNQRVSAAAQAKVFPPGSGGTATTSTRPINPRAYAGGVFPSTTPNDVSNYAAPGADPGRK